MYNSYLSQLLNNYKYLKTTDAISGYRKKKVIDEIDESEIISLKFWKINAFTNSAREPIILLIAGVVILGYYQWTEHINSVIIYSILLFYRTLNYILLAQSNWQSFHQFSGSIDNIIGTQTRLNNSVENHSGKAFTEFKKSISLQGADININDHKILSGINLNIPKNSTVALIGKSGAGKTTLASVITGLLTISNGHLLIDGIELNEYDVTSYRSRIGYVSQDAVIFNESIYNNVTLWTGDTIDDRSFFNEIVELTHLSDLINGLPEREKYHSW
ncbi:MAG: ABC transporter ATP-binding protein/permease [Saprospiraceae bacterium]|nr:ABC transporter ATP-binding protein/permease [Candidatus Brachybacter algidus]